MIAFIEKWLQNLSYYLIFTTVIVQIIPDKEYKKYIKFFCGLVLVLMLINPLMRLAEKEYAAEAERLYDNYIEEILKAGDVE